MNKLIRLSFISAVITFSISASDTLHRMVPVPDFLATYLPKDSGGAGEPEEAAGGAAMAAVRPVDRFLRLLTPHEMGRVTSAVARLYAREIGDGGGLQGTFPILFVENPRGDTTPSIALLQTLFKDAETPITAASHPASTISNAQAGAIARLVLHALRGDLVSAGIEPELGRVLGLPGGRIPPQSVVSRWFHERFVNAVMELTAGATYEEARRSPVLLRLRRAEYLEDPEVIDAAWDVAARNIGELNEYNLVEVDFKAALRDRARSLRFERLQRRLRHMQAPWQHNEYTLEEVEHVEELLDRYREFSPLQTHTLRARGRAVLAWTLRELLMRIAAGDEEEGVRTLQILGGFAMRKSLTSEEMDPFYASLMGRPLALSRYPEFRMSDYAECSRIILESPRRFHEMPEMTRRLFTDFSRRAIGGNVPWVGYTTASVADSSGQIRRFSNCWEAAFLNVLRTVVMRFEEGSGWVSTPEIFPEKSPSRKFFAERKSLASLATQDAIDAFASMVGHVDGVTYAKRDVEVATSVENTARLLCHAWGLKFKPIDSGVAAVAGEEDATRYVRVLTAVGEEITRVSGADFGLRIGVDGELEAGTYGLTGKLVFEVLNAGAARAMCKLVIENMHAKTERVEVPGFERRRDWRDAVVDDVHNLWEEQTTTSGSSAAGAAAAASARDARDDPELFLEFLSVVEPEAAIRLAQVLPATYFGAFLNEVDLTSPEVGIGILPGILRNFGNAALGDAPESELLKVAKLVEAQDDRATTQSFSTAIVPAVEAGHIPRATLLKLAACARIIPEFGAVVDPMASRLPVFRALCHGDEEMILALNRLMALTDTSAINLTAPSDTVPEDIRLSVISRLPRLSNIEELDLDFGWQISPATVEAFSAMVRALPKLDTLNFFVEDALVAAPERLGRLLAAVAEREEFDLTIRPMDPVVEMWGGCSKIAVYLAVQRCLPGFEVNCSFPSLDFARLYHRGAELICDRHPDAMVTTYSTDPDGSIHGHNVAGQLSAECENAITEAGSRDAYLEELRADREVMRVIAEAEAIEAEMRRGMAAGAGEPEEAAGGAAMAAAGACAGAPPLRGGAAESKEAE